MPELPEVETIANLLSTRIVGKTIKDIRVLRAKNVVSGADEFVSELTGKTFEDVGRAGKFLIFHLSDEKCFISHLRMEGKYFEGSSDDPILKHEIVRFNFTDGTRLSYIDTRKFGVLILKKRDELFNTPPLSELGPEPWNIDGEDIYPAYMKSRLAAKEILLDQGVMAGLGNIYADEVLFATHIHPLRKASALTEGDVAAIVRAARDVMDDAIEMGGSTIQSYHPADGVDGRMQSRLKAYGRVGKPCTICELPLKKIRVGGRGTTYCPHCQRDVEHPFVVSVTGKIASGKSTVSRYVEKLGYLRIDFDEIVHELYEKKNVIKKVASILGKDVVVDGHLDHKAMIKVMNEDAGKKHELEAYVHGLAYEAAIAKALEAKVDRVVFDVPFYLDSPLEEITGCLIYVETEDELRRQRLVERGKDPDEYLALNDSYPWDKVKKKATKVVRGNENPDYLNEQFEDRYFRF